MAEHTIYESSTRADQAQADQAPQDRLSAYEATYAHPTPMTIVDLELHDVKMAHHVLLRTLGTPP